MMKETHKKIIRKRIINNNNNNLEKNKNKNKNKNKKEKHSKLGY